MTAQENRLVIGRRVRYSTVSQVVLHFKLEWAKYIEPCAFLEKILSMKLDDQYIIFQALSERYRVANCYKSLLEELEWLKSIQELLLEQVKNRKGKLSGYNLNQLNKEYLKGIIEDLEKDQPS